MLGGLVGPLTGGIGLGAVGHGVPDGLLVGAVELVVVGDEVGVGVDGEAQLGHGVIGDVIEGLAEDIVGGGADDGAVGLLVAVLAVVAALAVLLAHLVALVIAVGDIEELNAVVHAVLHELHRAGQGGAALAHDEAGEGGVVPVAVLADDVGGVVDAVHQGVVDVAEDSHPLAVLEELSLLQGEAVGAGLGLGHHLIHVALADVEGLHHEAVALGGHLPDRRAHHVLIGGHGGIDAHLLLHAGDDGGAGGRVPLDLSPQALGQSTGAHHGVAVLRDPDGALGHVDDLAVHGDLHVLRPDGGVGGGGADAEAEHHRQGQDCR